jgi:hypothetical protein
MRSPPPIVFIGFSDLTDANRGSPHGAAGLFTSRDRNAEVNSNSPCPRRCGEGTRAKEGECAHWAKTREHSQTCPSPAAPWRWLMVEVVDVLDPHRLAARRHGHRSLHHTDPEGGVRGRLPALLGTALDPRARTARAGAGGLRMPRVASSRWRLELRFARTRLRMRTRFTCRCPASEVDAHVCCGAWVRSGASEGRRASRHQRGDLFLESAHALLEFGEAIGLRGSRAVDRLDALP